MEEGHIVKMFRVTSKYTEEIMSGMGYLPSTLEHRVFLSKWSIHEGNTVYFMNTTQLLLQDQGGYMCRVGYYENFEYVNC